MGGGQYGKKENNSSNTGQGGSRRIPHKNIINFGGKPLIQWTLEAATEACLFDRIFISTDDEEIAGVAQKFGVPVPFLRDKYGDDSSPSSLATIYALSQIEKHLNEEYDTVIQLMPNCPLRKAEHIVEAYRNFLCKKANFQISCFKFGWMNPWLAVKLDQDLRPTRLFPQKWERPGEREPLYCPTGAIWIARVPQLKRANTFYGEGHIFYPLDWKAAIDIDTYEDLEMARALLERKEE